MSNEETDDAQKTEDPTPKRLEEGRKRGQVALSREINNWIMLLTATILIGFAAGNVMGGLSDHMRLYLERAHDMPGSADGIAFMLSGAFKEVLSILALPFIVLAVAAFIAPFIQVGPLFAPEVIKPDFSKISPMKGFKRLFSLRSIMEFVKGILKISLISVVGVIILYPFYGRIDHMVGLPLPLMLDELLTLVIRLMIGVLVALIVVAVIDLLFQRSDHTKKMRMTKQELKDEYKQTEGDPHIKARLRSLRQERARQRMMAAVPDADVIITNPTHYSIALKYDPEFMEAPQCVAKGADDVALRIREVAKEHDIVIYEEPPLARVLFDLVDIDDFIPQEHYQAVAKIISYVFKLKGKLK
jgi:flagellar biosynthetic protein FlhB